MKQGVSEDAVEGVPPIVPQCAQERVSEQADIVKSNLSDTEIELLVKRLSE